MSFSKAGRSTLYLNSQESSRPLSRNSSVNSISFSVKQPKHRQKGLYASACLELNAPILQIGDYFKPTNSLSHFVDVGGAPISPEKEASQFDSQDQLSVLPVYCQDFKNSSQSSVQNLVLQDVQNFKKSRKPSLSKPVLKSTKPVLKSKENRLRTPDLFRSEALNKVPKARSIKPLRSVSTLSSTSTRLQAMQQVFLQPSAPSIFQQDDSHHQRLDQLAYIQNQISLYASQLNLQFLTQIAV